MDQVKVMFANLVTKVRENKEVVIKGAAIVVGATVGMVVAGMIAKHQAESEMLFNEDGFLGELDMEGDDDEESDEQESDEESE